MERSSGSPGLISDNPCCVVGYVLPTQIQIREFPGFRMYLDFCILAAVFCVQQHRSIPGRSNFNFLPKIESGRGQRALDGQTSRNCDQSVRPCDFQSFVIADGNHKIQIRRTGSRATFPVKKPPRVLPINIHACRILMRKRWNR